MARQQSSRQKSGDSSSGVGMKRRKANSGAALGVSRRGQYQINQQRK